MKKCPKCDSFLPMVLFNKNRGTRDGLTVWCKSCISIKKKAYYQENAEFVKAKRRKYFQENRQKSYDYARKKDISDPVFRMCRNVRNRIWKVLNGKTKSFRSIECSKDELKKHIESQFKPGMSWENYGKWHIDHKYPLALACKEGEEAFKKACHYTNLQPLWAFDNRSKGKKHA